MARERVSDGWDGVERGKEAHTLLEILLVGEDEQETVLHFAVVDDAVEFLSGFFYAVSVAGVNDEDQTLGAYGGVSGCFYKGGGREGTELPPYRAEQVLDSDVPLK